MRDSEVKVCKDSYFSGNWFPEQSKDDPDTERSHLGFVV